MEKELNHPPYTIKTSLHYSVAHWQVGVILSCEISIQHSECLVRFCSS